MYIVAEFGYALADLFHLITELLLHVYAVCDTEASVKILATESFGEQLQKLSGI